jgi:hypothetical protein
MAYGGMNTSAFLCRMWHLLTPVPAQCASPMDRACFKLELAHYSFVHTCVLGDLHSQVCAAVQEPHALENPMVNPISAPWVPFSASPSWERQRTFYRSKGINAWSDNHVPWQVSTNRFVASKLRDSVCKAIASLGAVSRVVVVELGAGHGLLSFLLSQMLHESLEDKGASHTACWGVRNMKFITD